MSDSGAWVPGSAARAATGRGAERPRASVAGDRSAAPARPAGGRLRREVAEPLSALRAGRARRRGRLALPASPRRPHARWGAGDGACLVTADPALVEAVRGLVGGLELAGLWTTPSLRQARLWLDAHGGCPILLVDAAEGLWLARPQDAGGGAAAFFSGRATPERLRSRAPGIRRAVAELRSPATDAIWHSRRPPAGVYGGSQCLRRPFTAGEVAAAARKIFHLYEETIAA